MKRVRNCVWAVVMLMGAVLIAQNMREETVANIPFPFIVAGQTLPAGHYVVSPVADNLLRIQSSGNQGTFVSTNSAQRSGSDNSSKLVFRRYGDSYFLSQVWVTGNARGKELPRSRVERELAAKTAATERTVVAER